MICPPVRIFGETAMWKEIFAIYGGEIAGGHHEIVAAAAEAVRQFRRLLGADRDCGRLVIDAKYSTLQRFVSNKSP